MLRVDQAALGAVERSSTFWAVRKRGAAPCVMISRRRLTALHRVAEQLGEGKQADRGVTRREEPVELARS
jgi:hypothetical protein